MVIGWIDCKWCNRISTWVHDEDGNFRASIYGSDFDHQVKG